MSNNFYHSHNVSLKNSDWSPQDEERLNLRFHANFSYMENFRHPHIQRGEISYLIEILRGAVTFITNLSHSALHWGDLGSGSRGASAHDDDDDESSKKKKSWAFLNAW